MKKQTIQKKAVFNNVATNEQAVEFTPVIDSTLNGAHDHPEQWLNHQQPIEVPKQPKKQTEDM